MRSKPLPTPNATQQPTAAQVSAATIDSLELNKEWSSSMLEELGNSREARITDCEVRLGLPAQKTIDPALESLTTSRSFPPEKSISAFASQSKKVAK